MDLANYRDLGVPVSLQVGASLDFVAGRIRRAPVWLRRHGLEWAFRLVLERRLARRYSRMACSSFDACWRRTEAIAAACPSTDRHF